MRPKWKDMILSICFSKKKNQKIKKKINNDENGKKLKGLRRGGLLFYEI